MIPDVSCARAIVDFTTEVYGKFNRARRCPVALACSRPMKINKVDVITKL